MTLQQLETKLISLVAILDLVTKEMQKSVTEVQGMRRREMAIEQAEIAANCQEAAEAVQIFEGVQEALESLSIRSKGGAA